MRYHIELEADGIYITHGYFSGGQWFEQTRWLIPGTED